MLIPAEIDFAECGREPVHVPGQIQAFGVLLVADPETGRVELVSDNAMRHLGLPGSALIGEPVTSCFDAAGAAVVEAALADLQDGAPRLLPALVHGRSGSGDRGLAVRVHRHDARLLVELEPATQPPGIPAALADDLDARLAAARNIHEASRIATAEARRLTGFDRVMIYRLLGDLGGEVVAEERSGLLTSLLGIRFPPHDYPPQAQRLQMLLGTRLVADVRSPQAGLVGAADTDPDRTRPVDMSHCQLRGVSGYCLEYLKGIGVATSLTAAILVDGALWGFVSCHNRKATPVAWPVRLALGALGDRLATHLVRLQAERSAEGQERLDRRLAVVRGHAAKPGRSLLAAALAEPPRLMDLLGAGGIALAHGSAVCRRGQVPGTGAILELTRWLLDRTGRTGARLYQTDTLSYAFEPAQAYRSQGSGLLALSLAQEPPCALLLFRPELKRDVVWGGDPTRPVTRDELKRLHPRSTFERWRQEVAGHARAWEPEDSRVVEELGRLLDAESHRSNVPVSGLVEQGLAAFRELLDESGFLREEMLAAVSEGMVLTAAVDAGGESRTLSANCRLCDIFHLDPTELIGAAVPVALDRIGLPSDLLDDADSLTEAREFDLWSECLGLRTMRVSAETIAEASGTDGGHRLVLLRLQDVTEFRRTVEALATMRDQQEAASQARAQFLAGIGHELRSPLNAIMGFAEAIKAELMGPIGSDIYRAYAEDIRQSGQHLLSLIADLLDLSKLEAGKRLVSEEACDLGAIVTEVFRWTQMQFDKKSLAWSLDVPKAPVLLTADQGGLRQVVINLLTNAGKFTRPGGRVVCRLSAPAGTDIVLTIEDTGIGIPPEEIEAVFQPYTRTVASRRSDQSGAGLGLSICRALVELHQGRVELASDGRNGTVARVILPAFRRLSEHQAIELMASASKGE